MRILAGSAVVMLAGFIVAIGGVQALARINTEARDPFLINAGNYIGQPMSAFEAYGFYCEDMNGNYDPRTLQCTLEAAFGSYSKIHVISKAGVIREIAFTMRTDAVQVGHLLLIWGRPEIRRYGRSVYLYWRTQRIMALIPRKPGLFSVSLPVWKVYFLEQTAQV